MREPPSPLPADPAAALRSDAAIELRFGSDPAENNEFLGMNGLRDQLDTQWHAALFESCLMQIQSVVVCPQRAPAG